MQVGGVRVERYYLECGLCFDRNVVYGKVRLSYAGGIETILCDWTPGYRQDEDAREVDRVLEWMTSWGQSLWEWDSVALRRQKLFIQWKRWSMKSSVWRHVIMINRAP